MAYNGTNFADLKLIGSIKKVPKRKALKAPKAPKIAAPRKAKLRKPLKITAGQLKYVKVTEKNPLKVSRDTKVGAAALAVAGRKGLQRVAGQVISKVGGVPVRALLGAGTKAEIAGTMGVIAMAGVLSYYITKYVLEAPDRKRATLQANAARAADAYRLARQKIASDQGRPLTATQQKQLGNLFKQKLQELGLSTNDLSKLTGKGYVPYTQ